MSLPGMEHTLPYTGEVAQLLALVEARRRYYRDMLSMFPAAAAVVAGDGSVSFANRAFCREFALSEENVARRTIGQILPTAALHQRIVAGRASGVAQPPLFHDICGRRLLISLVPVTNWEQTGAIDTLLVIESSRQIEPTDPEANKTGRILDLPDQISDCHIPAILWSADRQTLAFLSIRGDAQVMLGFSLDYWRDTPDFFRERIHSEDPAATLAYYGRALEQAATRVPSFAACRHRARPRA